MNWKDELFSEKSLFSLFKIARRVTSSTQNFTVLSSFSSVITIRIIAGSNDVIFSRLSESSMISINDTISNTGLALTTSILGFLIAGFSIFSSITRSEVLDLMGNARNDEHNMSWLKFTFLSFFIVFIHYFIFLVACALYKLFAVDHHGLITLRSEFAPDRVWNYRILVIWKYYFRPGCF